MPDAYKQCPVAPEHYAASVQAIQAPSGTWEFQVCYTLLFGFSDAVLGFSAVSKFLETVARRMLLLLTTMSYDGANSQDLLLGYGCAQD